MTIRLALVDDQELVRSGLAMVCEDTDDLTVVVEAGDGLEAVTALAHTPVDVVLMDVQMPRMDGVEATRRILARPDPPKVIVLTTFDFDEYVLAALRAGASGFLLKDASRVAIVAAIRAVHVGDAVLAPTTTRRLLDQLVNVDPGRAQPRQLARLSERERDVFDQLVRGLSNAEIAHALTLADSTVKSHVRQILAKLEVRDRVQAVIFAYENGLGPPS